MGRRRRKIYESLPPNTYRDVAGLRWRNPQTGKFFRLLKNRNEALALARTLNERLAGIAVASRMTKILGTGDKTLAQVITEYREKSAPHKPWDEGTRENVMYQLKVYEREFGERLIRCTDRLWLANWLEARGGSNETYNRHRERLIDLYDFALSRSYVQGTNEAACLLKRSLSKKLIANRKVRSRLELDGYRAIYAHQSCPTFLKVAMELSLITLQARRELVHMKYTDERAGYLFVIRDKTSAESDMAFIRIKLTPVLAALIKTSREDAVLSPFIVHHKPARRRREQMDNKTHWTEVGEDYLTRAFKQVRDATKLWMTLPGPQRPTFHEIRSLGARTYVDGLGYERKYAQRLMTHTQEKTTGIYLENGAKALNDADYIEVFAELDPSRI